MVVPKNYPVQFEYPETDYQPMAETDVHRLEMNNVTEMLSDFFRDQNEVYVAANLLLYYEEENPNAVIAPDVFVVKGIEKKNRRVYKLWEEQHVPCFVLEVSSRSTRFHDVGTKRAIYATLGVNCYMLYDPLHEFLSPILQGFQLVDHDYERMKPDENGALVVEELGLKWTVENQHLCLIDLAANQKLLTPAENAEARRNAEARLSGLEAEVQLLRMELNTLRNKK